MGWTTTMKACKHEVRCGYCEENHCYRGTTCEHYKEWDCDKIKEENNMNRCIHEFICRYSAVAPCYHGSYCKSYDDSGIEIEKKENNMNEKELKMGDIVEVAFHCDGVVWNESIFVKYGIDNSIIVVQSSDNTKFLAGEPFDTFKYTSGHWRIPKQKTYRPFTWEEREQLRGKWVKWEGADTEHFITTITKTYVILMEKNDWVTFQELRLFCIFVDSGLPCGVEETK
jgi:hypothetical protein